ncbi:DUF1573 domain-containing protein [Flavisolibacter ginsenosidimutans]|uniref:DUF1573 domain-containing protein n=1 Tax=Flavisolibacter ginsenosidimutans TaxID=661481 RepID=A0A5B8UF63_9BACT|nr:DUF1573 domain-containing protein [Flavisolibacter ginsenosidimutans]QEC55148.1 DUF1573 domain-containing protein [Flavisolibacter ginsenosidimutans]
MKHLFFILIGTSLFACNVNDTKVAGSNDGHAATSAVKDSANFTSIQWLDSTTQSLGNLTEGQVAEISWRFKNTGNKPLVIEDVQPGCGCTVADKPTEPIAPGGEGVIKAKFNSDGHPGHADKHISVLANLSNHNNGGTTQLGFTADVKAKS